MNSALRHRGRAGSTSPPARIVSVEIDRAAEESIPEKVRVEVGLIHVEEPQSFLEEIERLVVILKRVRVQRLERQRLRGHVVVLRVAERLVVQLLRLRKITLLMRQVSQHHVRLVLDVVGLRSTDATRRESAAGAGQITA